MILKATKPMKLKRFGCFFIGLRSYIFLGKQPKRRIWEGLVAFSAFYDCIVPDKATKLEKASGSGCLFFLPMMDTFCKSNQKSEIDPFWWHFPHSSPPPFHFFGNCVKNTSPGDTIQKMCQLEPSPLSHFRKYRGAKKNEKKSKKVLHFQGNYSKMVSE